MKRMIRKPVTARLGVEGLEGRELMAAGFTLVDTLNAKDTIDLDRLGVIAGIETLRSENVTELQTVIASATLTATNARCQRSSRCKSQLAQAIAISDQASANSIQADRSLALTDRLENVRLAMRQATAVATTVDKALQTDEKQINAIYNAAIGQLARHANPFTLVPPVVNALTVDWRDRPDSGEPTVRTVSARRDTEIARLTDRPQFASPCPVCLVFLL